MIFTEFASTIRDGKGLRVELARATSISGESCAQKASEKIDFSLLGDFFSLSDSR
jgi:hypothetical protein